MQQTEQVEELESEFISLREFIPKWTYVNLVGKTSTEKWALESEMGLTIINSHHCIVGEAHGGDSYDDCSTCHFMSYGSAHPWTRWDKNKVPSPAIHANGDPVLFMKLKKELYSHMIDNHPEKMRR